MTLPRCVADVLADHVRLEIECIDRMYLNVFVPELQRTGQVIGSLMGHRGFPIASTALVAPMTRQFVSDIHFAAAHGVPLIRFAKGQRKDDVTAAHLAGFTGREGIATATMPLAATAAYPPEEPPMGTAGMPGVAGKREAPRLGGHGGAELADVGAPQWDEPRRQEEAGLSG
jgi:hypothetical protein